MNFRFWKKNGAQLSPPAKPLPRFELTKFDLSMTLAQWRDSGTHLAWMRTMLASDPGREMLGVLFNESPQHDLPLRREKLSDIQAAIELGRCRGFAEAIESLTLMTQPVPIQETVEADFGAEAILREMNYPLSPK